MTKESGVEHNADMRIVRETRTQTHHSAERDAEERETMTNLCEENHAQRLYSI